MTDLQAKTVGSETIERNQMEAKFKQFVRHQNRLWAVRSLLIAAAILGASAIMPDQIWLGFLWLLPALSLAVMYVLQAAARKNLLMPK